MAVNSGSVKMLSIVPGVNGFKRPCVMVNNPCLSMRGVAGSPVEIAANIPVFFGQQSARSESPKRRQLCVVRASEGGHEFSFDTDEYVEAHIENVRHTDKYGHVIYLRLKDEEASVLPVYIGDAECAALVKEINKKPTVRPMTHDLMKNSLEMLGYRVSRVRVTALVGNTYHARVHFRRATGDEDEVDIDARPSDAINLAVRFNAPVYVNKGVAARMAHPVHTMEKESSNDVVRSCRDEILHHKDPTVMLKLQLQMAIAEERYVDAAQLRDDIDRMLSTDRALGLVVALESALDGHRYEEAAYLRDELRKLRAAAKDGSGMNKSA